MKRADGSYHFKANDKSAQAAVRRVALSQIDAALDEIGSSDLSPEHIVHQIRKRCKKLRSLIRLVRPGFADYARENASFRDLARGLGNLRDRDVLVQTCDKMMAHYGGNQAILAVRERLAADKLRLDAGPSEEKFAAVRSGMVSARQRVQMWVIDDDGFTAFSGGLRRVLKNSRSAMEEAKSDPRPEAMHEWRKAVKYHGYHARLLRDIWPEAMLCHIAATSELAEFLGDYHDLAVLQRRLADQPEHIGGVDVTRLVAALADRRKNEFAKEAFRLGAMLFAERSAAITRRWERYWQIWRGEM